jgi:hypothetical protein
MFARACSTLVSLLEETGFEFALHVQQDEAAIGVIDVRGTLGAAHADLLAEAMALVAAPALVVSLAECASCSMLGLRALAREHARRGRAMCVVASSYEDTRAALAAACPDCGLQVLGSVAAARAAAEARLPAD